MQTNGPVNIAFIGIHVIGRTDENGFPTMAYCGNDGPRCWTHELPDDGQWCDTCLSIFKDLFGREPRRA